MLNITGIGNGPTDADVRVSLYYFVYETFEEEGFESSVLPREFHVSNTTMPPF